MDKTIKTKGKLFKKKYFFIVFVAGSNATAYLLIYLFTHSAFAHANHTYMELNNFYGPSTQPFKIFLKIKNKIKQNKIY